MTTVVWREWFNEAAVKKMTEMGTLPRDETEIEDAYVTDGSDAAAELVRQANKSDFEAFREGGKIVIIEPEYYAGTYDVTVDYEPYFDAFKSADT